MLGLPDNVIEHFLNPHNVGTIESPEGIATITNPLVAKYYERGEKKELG